MSDKSGKKIFGKTSLLPWRPTALPRALPSQPSLSNLSASQPLKALKPAPTKGDYRREVFEQIFSRPIELDKFAEEVVLRYRDLDGEHEIRTCPGDIYKIVNVFMDYARLLELVCDEWDLGPYHRAVNEVTADKLRSIAKKYQEAIGYDYEAALAKCEAKKKKTHKDDDVGADALELAFKKDQQKAAKKKKEESGIK